MPSFRNRDVAVIAGASLWLNGAAGGQALQDRHPETPHEPVTAVDPVLSDDPLFRETIDEEDNFGELSLEQLMSIEVTSVAGVARPLLETPSAIFVITAEDLRRTGSRNIAEALRMVPGMQVGQVAANKWAISARGFNSVFASKMLVLVDGRSVYDQIFSGVFWEIEDLPLEDIDRIEVVRGPGATLWGVNAVNGVVNIRTRSARDTQGAYFTAGVGTEFQEFGQFRWGDQLGENAWYRVWGAYQNTDSSVDVAGDDRPDDWSFFRGGARVDWDGDDGLSFTVQGDGYATNQFGEGTAVPVPGHQTFSIVHDDGFKSGGTALFRATYEDSSDAGWSLQTYYSRLNARSVGAIKLERDTVDLDFRQHFSSGEDHDVIWGAGFRFSHAQIDAGPRLTFDDLSRETNLVGGFIQDTITIVPERLNLMLGSKFSHNDFTGFEIQPSARVSWTPDDTQTVWGAVSRAVRTPARVDDDMTFITTFVDSGLASGGPASGIFVPLTITGDSNNDSEELIAFEVGYRSQVSERITLDVAGFYHDYDKLLIAPLPSGPIGNSTSAELFGVEIAATIDITDRWKLSGNYSYLNIQVHDPGVVDDADAERDTPQQQFHLRSYVDLTEDLEFNSALYFVDAVPGNSIPAYTRLDLGLTWRPGPNVEISLWGQNLLDGAHLEQVDDFLQDARSEIERGVYARFTVRF